MTSLPSGSQWGSPNASKRAFLIHGLAMASHTWDGVAQALASAGYFVTAPNLAGHGYRQANNLHLHVEALAKDLLPYFSDGMGYDCIIGHSLGGAVAAALLPFLPSTKRTSVILVDPALEIAQEVWAMIREFSNETILSTKPVETLVTEYPLWARQDVIGWAFAAKMCTTKVVEEICNQNEPWSFSYLLQKIPSHVFVTVLLADYKLSPACPVERIPVHPQIRAVVLDGVDHWIQYVKPDLVISTALSSVAKLEEGHVVQ